MGGGRVSECMYETMFNDILCMFYVGEAEDNFPPCMMDNKDICICICICILCSQLQGAQLKLIVPKVESD